MRDPWTVLQVPRDADEETVRRAYRRLVKLYHPDLARGSRMATKNSRKLEEIIEAYQRLLSRRRPFAAPPASGRRPPNRSGLRGTQSRRDTEDSRSEKPGRGSEARSRDSRSAGAWNKTKRSKPGAGGIQGKTSSPSVRESIDPSRWARYGELLVSGRNAAIRAMAAKTLGDLGRRSAYGYLRQAFSDSEDRVVCEAVRAVGRIGIRQAKGELITLFSRGSPAIKHAVLDCVEELGDLEEYGSLLYSALKDPYASVRERGVPLLARYQKVRAHAGKKS